MSTLFQKFFHIFKTLFFLAIIKNRAIIQLKSPQLYILFLVALGLTESCVIVSTDNKNILNVQIYFYIYP